MPAPAAQTLQRVASETGRQAGTIETVLRLMDLLQEIGRDEVLRHAWSSKAARR